MTGENCSVKNVKIAYVGGGSHAWAWVFMNDLAKETVLSGTVRLYDIDAEAAENNRKIGTRLFEREDVKGNFKFETSASLRKALTGADFVVISILPGTFDEMESDVHLPERCGIYQSVGDTAGPGGLVRALRTIPMYVEEGTEKVDNTVYIWYNVSIKYRRCFYDRTTAEIGAKSIHGNI